MRHGISPRRAYREAQIASWAGRQQEAERLLQAAARRPPRHLPLQAALIAGRRNKPELALRRLAEAPRELSERPAYRLFRGWFAARAGQLHTAAEILAPLAGEAPDNRVAATALAYLRLREGRAETALELLRAGPGDNDELLSWTWVELERWVQAQPPPPEPCLSPPSWAAGASERSAHRWFRAGQAAAMDNTNCLWRRRWLRRCRLGNPIWKPLAGGLLERLERLWPSEPLTAFLAVDEAGFPLPGLDFELGAQLYEAGSFSAALPRLSQATAAMAESPEGYLPALYLAGTLIELQRWDDASAALAEVARREQDEDTDDAGATHEFAQPHWHLCRARIRVASGELEAAQRDLLRALAGEPLIFADRLRQLERQRPEDSGAAGRTIPRGPHSGVPDA